MYYVFPGGRMEEGEASEETTVREIYEELGIHIQIQRLAMKIRYNGTQYFYEAIIVGETFGDGKGEEYIQTDREQGKYIPIWVPIKELLDINIKPLEVGEYAYKLYENSKFTSINKKH